MTEPKRSFSARFFRFTFKWLLYFVIGSVALTAIYAVVPVPTTLTMLFDSNGATRDWTRLSNISPNLVRGVIAAEDGKFCSHDGFDREAIEKALQRNKSGGRMRGGSTISQQTAKNVFLWQGSGWTRYLRKVPEVYFTFLIETIWGKRRIMEVYLNVAETGIGTYGAEAGAQRYYKKSAKNLTRQEAARIAAVLPLPKKRAVHGAGGFTRRYGNSIASRIRVVQRDGLDNCIYK
ncbi:MAG TPA: monofunctional biosynthetic peptidoglycan transglycosylase [Sphingorhabdus lacus]|jgi:monofunctional biosynthetic peptidoglycan transglycosylase|uniref:monofunctional biosynthetic peptidoglycan transglycosylase n=1 Tax=Sphingorhabdus lacus TaxID=392610 RepID=UPI002B5ECCE9|nr:monofunctional biosynthetic peptidoglycan transglycosylase [Sphingorhabdus lacus]HPV67093.1 monofunctional biosynthetic peptidoglycan transglycosylase [Sphingorhabdus lacus]